ncbi:MAG: hypothetical protein HeimC3_40950 [Candidatus Heimdallarchaeota archaeon LC_3]|nr:MAG: hypothetical protein HeimC3_40950 [Candidatus Heimdallarchaeota archaeon LC_3]
MNEFVIYKKNSGVYSSKKHDWTPALGSGSQRLVYMSHKAAMKRMMVEIEENPHLQYKILENRHKCPICGHFVSLNSIVFIGICKSCDRTLKQEIQASYPLKGMG